MTITGSRNLSGEQTTVREQFDLLKSYGQHQDEDEHEAIGMMTSMRNVDSRPR